MPDSKKQDLLELGREVVALQSGPLRGDQQIGGKVVEGAIDFLIS